MRKELLLCLLLGACGTSAPPPETPPVAGEPEATEPPDPPRTREPEETPAPEAQAAGSRALHLPSGLSLSLQVDPGQPRASAALCLTPSPLAEPSWFSSLAFLGLVAGGSTRLPGRAFLGELQRSGARLETHWRLGCLRLQLDAPPEALEACLSLLHELILFPAYPEETLEAALEAPPREERPLWAALAGDPPPPLEELPTRPGELPSSDRMRRWHAAAFHPGASRLALLGPLPMAQTLEILARTFALWQAEGPPLARQAVPAEPGLYWTDAAEGSGCVLTLLAPLGSPWDETWPARRVLGRLLAGLGARGRIPEALGLAGLAKKPLQVRWQAWPGAAFALAVSLEGLEPDQIAPALTALAEALREIAAPKPDPLELAAAIRGAWCEERLALLEPEAALERGLALADRNRHPLLEGPLALPLEPLNRVGPRMLAEAGPSFRLDQVRVHVEGPAALRADPRFADALPLPRPAGLAPSQSPTLSAPTPEEEALGRDMLTRAIEALGGETALSRLAGLRLEGRVQWHLGPEVAEEWSIQESRLQRDRSLLGLSVRARLEKDAEGWTSLGEERQALLPAAAAQLKRDLEGNLLWLLSRFDRKEGLLAAAGEEQWQGVPLVRVRLGPPGPDAPILAIDPLSGLPRVLHHPGRGGVRDLLLDYRDPGALRHPFRVERWRRGERLWVFSLDAVHLEER